MGRNFTIRTVLIIIVLNSYNCFPPPPQTFPFVVIETLNSHLSGKWRNSIEVAVKTLRQGAMSTQAFLQEAAIMKKFRHDRLVALYAVCSKQEPVYIVTEYMAHGSLLEFLRNGDGKDLGLQDLIYIASQVKI